MCSKVLGIWSNILYLSVKYFFANHLRCLTNFASKSSILEVSVGSQYTFSAEMLLGRFCQSSKFWKKS